MLVFTQGNHKNKNMSERHPDTRETLPPSPLNPADLAGVAFVAAELSNVPDVDIEQQEAERKKNTIENLRKLSNYFGDRFVNGERKEGGGYVGGAARELLSEFMEMPDFTSELQRLIPSKHGALQLLKDNQAYIQSVLEQLYKDDPTRERAPAKDPYQLAHSVGYELTGPFQATSEFMPYAEDFRQGERICTYNAPVERLQNYHILWLRHSEADATLPADRLTADTLSEAWKTYLKTIGRHDEEADTYNLVGLRPTREDPYGVSSMSVQISRTGTHVSIKNRYNHTVGNPDNTLDSNLDTVAYGLRQAVYTRVGREDLLSQTNAVPAEGYITDNEGGLHRYNYEENNVYYGDYEYVENSVVTTINRSKFVMISPQLYIRAGNEGKVMSLRPKKAEGAEMTVSEDVRFLYRNSHPNEAADRVTQLRREYAERDKAELAASIRESLVQQARAAYDTYRDMAMQLHTEAMTKVAFDELIDRKMVEWQNNGVIDYLVGELVEKGSRPNLVATPNILADWWQIKQLADQFGEGQPFGTDTNDVFLKQYSPEELSGALVGEPVRLSIIPSVSNMQPATVDEQKEQLAVMRAAQPRLNFRVPSMLEAIAYWQTLRARGAGVNNFNATYIRHFDQPVRRDGRIPCVPDSYVYEPGDAFLDGDLADGPDVGRVSMG